MYLYIFIQLISYLITIITGIKLLKYFDLSLKLILTLISLGFMVDIIGLTYVLITKIQNLFIYQFYSILELVLLSFFYITIINSLLIKRLILFLLLIFSLITLTNFFSKDIYYNLCALENFLISCYVLCFFIYSMNYNPKKISTEFPLFWINSGILIYYMTFILIHLFSNYLIKTSNSFLLGLTNNSNNILTLVFMTFIIIGFLKSKNKNHEIKTE